MRFTSYPCAISKFLELIFITSKSWSVVLLKEFIFITKMRKLTKRQSLIIDFYRSLWSYKNTNIQFC